MTTPSLPKVYLGDRVYAEFDGYNLVLTTEDGISVQNTIYLEPSVWRALVAFMSSLDQAKETTT